MRLIDADAYRDDFMQTVYDLFSDEPDNIKANLIIDAFDRIPTAYDPNKVVQQLENLKTINVDIGFGITVSTLRKDVVMEIVKEGGTDGN